MYLSVNIPLKYSKMHHTSYLHKPFAPQGSTAIDKCSSTARLTLRFYSQRSHGRTVVEPTLLVHYEGKESKEADANGAPAARTLLRLYFPQPLCAYEDELPVESNLQKSNSDILTCLGKHWCN